jgi:hypothetical protein
MVERYQSAWFGMEVVAASDYDALAAEIEAKHKALIVETDRTQAAWRKQWELEARLAEAEEALRLIAHNAHMERESASIARAFLRTADSADAVPCVDCGEPTDGSGLCWKCRA